MTIDFEQIQKDVNETRSLVEALVYNFTQVQNSALPIEEVLNTNQAATLLDLKKSTIYGLVYERRIPYHHVGNGGRLYFLRTELIDWIKNGRVATSNELDEQARKQVAARLTRRNNSNERKGGRKNHE
ncbi:helix-turn-helix domain-containing protein [Spirosoma pomorum]